MTARSRQLRALVRRPGVLLGVAALVLAPGAAAQTLGQTLTLREALQRAERGGYANRIGRAAADAERARATGALRGVLPSLRFETGWSRTTDPLGAFGFILRQRVVTPSAFAPASLNDPAAISNLGSAIVLEQPVVNLDAWLERRAAQRAAAAAAEGARWTRAGTGVEVVRAYYGAVFAADRAATLAEAARAAHAHARQAETLHQGGVVTRSDALLASVRAANADAELIAAEGDVRVARRELGVVLGDPADTSFTLPAALPTADAVHAAVEVAAADRGALERRADVVAATLAAEAAQADLTRARSLYLPRLNSVGRLDWNSASDPYGGKVSWTLGLVLSWSPFAGAGEIGDIRAADARRQSARAARDAAAAQAGLELQRADNALAVALARLDVATRAVTQTAEAHRIVSRKYDGGLATVVELFDAAAAETQSKLALADARYRALTALAERRRALGLDLSVLEGLGP